jgi:hypothetical protein
MGARYGHASRMLLNHDLVFLAEMLTHIAGEPAWSVAYRSYNCLSLPSSDENEIPVALDYAAAVTILLAHFRIEDHSQDSPRARWSWAARLLSPTYRRAAARLKAWGFPLDELTSMLRSQAAREANPQSLADVAEPTAFATGVVFSHGARVVGHDEAAGRMEQIGRRFGTLIYVLDAFEDQKRDAREGTFNALGRFPEIDARGEILSLVAQMEAELPEDLGVRLRLNVEERLGLRPRVLGHACRKPLRDRWRDAVALAHRLRARERGGWIKGAMVLSSVAALGFLFPHHTRVASTWRECLGVGMNLMALGTLFAAPAEPPAQKSGGGASKCIGNCCSGCDGCDDCCCADCCCDGCCSACDC